MRYVSFASVLTLVAACSGGSAAPQPDGPPKLGVVSGNNQVVTAAPAAQNELPQPVVAQAVRTPGGQVSFRVWVRDAADRALLPPRAYAQVPVNGIPGITVCATQPDPKHALVAVVPCASTDAAGKAYFTFRADTVAGVSKAHVAASLSTGVKVTDSVSATVKTTPAAGWVTVYAGGSSSYQIDDVRVGDTLRIRDRIAGVWDKYNNTIYGNPAVMAGRPMIGSPTAFRVRYRRINNTTSLSDAALVDGDKIVIRAGDALLQLAIDSLPPRDLSYRLIP